MNRPMTHDESKACAEQNLEFSYNSYAHARDRVGELSDEFARLEVQVATILLAFGSLFLEEFGKTPDWFWIKVSYAFGLAFLLASLTFGLLHLKSKEWFWQAHMNKKLARSEKWLSHIKGDCSIEEALAYHDGSAHPGRGGTASTHPWPWILQTICLGAAVVILFILGLIFVFNTPTPTQVVEPIATSSPAV